MSTLARKFTKVLQLWRQMGGRRASKEIVGHVAGAIRRMRCRFVTLARPYGVQAYEGTITVLSPLNYLLSLWLKNRTYTNSVLHISYMVHIPYYTTRLLRRLGMKADYLAMEGSSAVWDKSDFIFIPSHNPIIRALEEFMFFWKVVAKYEIIHCHFAVFLSSLGWEAPVLKRMGRKIVIHYRGCEIRDREKNMALHPDLNICQTCDYSPTYLCKDRVRRKRCELAEKYGDLFLVTTPDMKDFVPQAIHFPFFVPEIDAEDYLSHRARWPKVGEIKIVHVTGQPGIEGTLEIRGVIDRLRGKGYPIQFVSLHSVEHQRVLREIADADLTVGKMKMGYYANAQIESMFLGVPAVTYVRPEFMTGELEKSGFIFSSLTDLEKTLEFYLEHPDCLEAKRSLARSSILRLHNNEELGKSLIAFYESTKERKEQVVNA